MTVTRITELSKSRVQIIIDNEFAFVLYKGELRMYHLEEGKVINQDVYKEIIEVLLPKRAKLRAMNLLKSRAYTTKQLTDKLKTGGYPEEIISEAINYVTSYGYLNDLQYAKDFIEYNKEAKTKTKIINTLLQKGITKSVVQEAWEAVGEVDNTLEYQQILDWMRRKNFDNSTASFEERQKFCAFLYRKGFQIDTIRCALSLDITSI